jgi:hypothetical protein
MNIAKKRLYKNPEDGGLGLFNINDFLDAQKCAWIRRSLDLNEPWKVLLYVKNFGCILNSKARNINPLEYPISHSICLSYERMTNAFTCINENFLNCSIFENSKITRTLESREQCCRNLFSNDFFLENANTLYGLRYNHFYDNTGIAVTREQLHENLGLNLTILQYFVLRNACNVARIRYKKNETAQQRSVCIETLMLRRRKGSNHLRKLFAVSQQLETPHNIQKFASNIDIVITNDQSRVLNSLWKCSYFTNSESTFLFKFYNNTLGYNNAVSHFVRGHSPICTFCNITNEPDQNHEIPSHLFFDCPSVSEFVENIFKRVTDDEDFAIGKREFFTTFEYREYSFAKNKVLTVISKFLIKYIWDCKVRYTVPRLDDCCEILQERIGDLIRANCQFRKLWNVANLNQALFRHP